MRGVICNKKLENHSGIIPLWKNLLTYLLNATSKYLFAEKMEMTFEELIGFTNETY